MSDFQFNFETVEELPKFGGGGGGHTQKYDWSQWPEPTKGAYPKARIDDVKNSKTLRTSINRYYEKQREAGVKEEDLPVFRIQTVKDPESGKQIGFDVYRVPNRLHPEQGKLHGAIEPPKPEASTEDVKEAPEPPKPEASTEEKKGGKK